MKKKSFPKITIVIPLWQRADIFKMVSKQLEVVNSAISDRLSMDVLCIISDNDPERKKLNNILSKADYTVNIVSADNMPLGRKVNTGIEVAYNNGFDYLMNLGSDDLIHPALFDLYYPAILEKVPFFGVQKLYFYDFTTLIHFSYYNNPNLVGAGRMIHYDVITEIRKKFGTLYDDEICRAMDSNSAAKIQKARIKQRSFDAGDFPFIVDLKSGVNINSFDRIANSQNRQGIRKMDPSVVTSIFKIN